MANLLYVCIIPISEGIIKQIHYLVLACKNDLTVEICKEMVYNYCNICHYDGKAD